MPPLRKRGLLRSAEVTLCETPCVTGNGRLARTRQGCVGRPVSPSERGHLDLNGISENMLSLSRLTVREGTHTTIRHAEGTNHLWGFETPFTGGTQLQLSSVIYQ